MTVPSECPRPPLKTGGVVLCGGRSSRMGRAKALLSVGHEVLLQRVVRKLSQVVSPIVVVAAEGQELPPLDATIVYDPVEYRGPLAGLGTGLAVLRHQVDAVYLTGCDVPLLSPQFVDAVISKLGDAEIVVPQEGKFLHPLAAVYRTSVLPEIEKLLSADQLRPVYLFERCRTYQIPCEELRSADPDLESLMNTNTPEEYARVLTRVVVQDRELPLDTYIPGVTSRPEHDQAEPADQRPALTASPTAAWRDSEDYLWGRRLFHNGYYWEAHEVWERVWNALGRHGPQADFIKGFIKLAAAGVKLGERNPKGVQRHLARAMELLQQSLGQLPELKDRVQIEDWRAFMDGAWSQTRIGLAPPSGQPKVLLPWLPRSD